MKNLIFISVVLIALAASANAKTQTELYKVKTLSCKSVATKAARNLLGNFTLKILLPNNPDFNEPLKSQAVEMTFPDATLGGQVPGPETVKLKMNLVNSSELLSTERFDIGSDFGSASTYMSYNYDDEQIVAVFSTNSDAGDLVEVKLCK